MLFASVRALFIVVLSVAAMACMQTSAPSPANSQSGQSVDALTPDEGSATAADGASDAAAVQGVLSVATAAAPDLCLGTGSSASGIPSGSAAALVLRPCALDASQRWVLHRGQLRNNMGLCLTLQPDEAPGAPSGALIAVAATCSTTGQGQDVRRQGAQLLLQVQQQVVALGVAGLPQTSSLVQAQVPDAQAEGQKWALAQDSHDDHGALLLLGTRIVAQDEPGTCLQGGSNGNVLFYPCSADPQQSWRLNTLGGLQSQGRCLEYAQGNVSMVLCNQGAAQQWGIRDGNLVAPTPTDAPRMCLDVVSATDTTPASPVPVVRPCAAGTRRFVVGPAL